MANENDALQERVSGDHSMYNTLLLLNQSVQSLSLDIRKLPEEMNKAQRRSGYSLLPLLIVFCFGLGVGASMGFTAALLTSSGLSRTALSWVRPS